MKWMNFLVPLLLWNELTFWYHSCFYFTAGSPSIQFDHGTPILIPWHFRAMKWMNFLVPLLSVIVKCLTHNASTLFSSWIITIKSNWQTVKNANAITRNIFWYNIKIFYSNCMTSRNFHCNKWISLNMSVLKYLLKTRRFHKRVVSKY